MKKLLHSFDRNHFHWVPHCEKHSDGKNFRNDFQKNIPIVLNGCLSHLITFEKIKC